MTGWFPCPKMQRPSDRPKPGNLPPSIPNRYVDLHDAKIAMQKSFLAGNRSSFEAAWDELDRKSNPRLPSKTSKAELALFVALILSVPVSMGVAATLLQPFWRTFHVEVGPGNCGAEMEGTHPQSPSKIDEGRYPDNRRK